MSLLPLHFIMGIDVVTALIAISPLFFIPIPQPQPAAGDEDSDASILQQMRSGFRYVWAWPGLKAVLVVIMLINFIVDPAFSLMPLLVTEHFKGGASQLGWLESAWGFGMMLGGIGLGIWGGFRRRVFTSFSGMIVGGLAIFCFGLVPGNRFAWGVAALLITGITNPFINGPFFAIVQGTVEPAMQGRVFTLAGSLATAMMPLSLAIAGPLSDLIGIRTWYVGGGAIFALVGVALFFVPAIVNLEHNNEGLKTVPAGQSAAPLGD